MKEYNIKYKNRNYDLNDHKTSNNLNIIQNDEIERLTEFNTNLLKDIDKLISKKTELETELDIIRSDNKNYRKIIITLIKALNDNELPIPEFYKTMLGVKECEAGMPIYYQKLPEEVKAIPEQPDEQLQALIQQYS